jgi:hypothetical protein
MTFNKKNIASLFVCLLIFNALSTCALASPNRYRKAKGVTFTKNLQNKQYAVPNTILLQRHSEKTKKCRKNSSCPSTHTRHTEFSRCYQTVGTGRVTIDEVVNSCESVDTVVSKQIHLKTLSSHTTRFNVLTNTTTERKFLRHVSETIQTLTTVHRAVKTLVPVSVTLDVLTSQTVEIGKLTSHSELVQTLRCSQKTIRVKTTYETDRRRVTSTEGVIRHVMRIHENVSQSAPRTVTSENYKCHKSHRSGSSNHSSNGQNCGCA